MGELGRKVIVARTRAPTRGGRTGGEREYGGEGNVGGAHEGTHKGWSYGG